MGSTLKFEYGYSSDQNRFLEIPKALIENNQLRENISSDAILLYGFLLDRMKSSLACNCIDSDNRLYTMYSTEDAMKDLHLSRSTIVKSFRSLEDSGLIKRKIVGQGRPSLIYVSNVSKGVLP